MRDLQFKVYRLQGIYCDWCEKDISQKKPLSEQGKITFIHINGVRYLVHEEHLYEDDGISDTARLQREDA